MATKLYNWSKCMLIFLAFLSIPNTQGQSETLIGGDCYSEYTWCMDWAEAYFEYELSQCWSLDVWCARDAFLEYRADMGKCQDQGDACFAEY